MLREAMGIFGKRCPHCRSIDIRNVGLRSTIERAIYWLVSPYRCGLCGHHFFLWRWQAPIGDAA
jgi:hypothetical protein